MIPFAMLVVVKATLLCGTAFLLAQLCRRARASIRHLTFSLVFIALVAIPAASLFPAVEVTVPMTAAAQMPPRMDFAAAVWPDGAAAPPESVRGSQQAPSQTSVTMTQALITVWLLGVAVFLAPVALGSWQIYRLRRRSWRWTAGETLVQSLAPGAGITVASTYSFTTR